MRGTDLDGHRAELVFSISKKLYRCPSCRASIEIGAEHVLVRWDQVDGDRFHQHWHRSCVEQELLPNLRGTRTVPV